MQGTQGYREEAATLVPRYEGLRFEDVQREVIHLFPAPPAQVLDVGAGTGRDAEALEYIWVGDLPLAVLDGSVSSTNPTLLWVHADHLKRPELMTNAARTIVWKALYEPFGAVHQITGTAALDLRFPGQWFQLEPGLAYNWHHYDAALGRYTQPDPLGLNQGPSAGAAGPDAGTALGVMGRRLSSQAAGRPSFATFLASLSSLQQDGLRLSTEWTGQASASLATGQASMRTQGNHHS